MDIKSIINYSRPKETYYDLLGCHPSSNVEQINREYKIRALQLHPDKNPDPNSAEKFQQLQKAKDVLTDAKSRKTYDTWLNSGIQIPFEQFQLRNGHSMHWAAPRQTKQSIQGQNMASNEKGESNRMANDRGGSLLDKFRNYEI